jgi:midasin
MERGLQSISKKKDTQYQALIRKFQGQVQDLKMRSRKMESQGGFIFQFVEGTLIKSMQNGDWVLLDEINLASETILNKLATII